MRRAVADQGALADHREGARSPYPLEGADSKVADIERFSPFAGLGEVQKDVMFSCCLGRENKTKSDGWEELRPTRNMVGPELIFAREVKSTPRRPSRGSKSRRAARTWPAIGTRTNHAASRCTRLP